jgi:hypothetical protein
MGVFCEFESVAGMIERPFRMPVASRIVAFLIVLGCSTMGARRQLMLFGGLAVRFVHGFLLVEC